MNLIANSGLQFFTAPLEINKNDNFKMYFHEWEDTNTNQLKLEIAHFFSDESIWVSKMDLGRMGIIIDDKIGYRDADNKFKSYKWDDIKENFLSKYKEINPRAYNNDQLNCFQISATNSNWSKFENVWLPFPMFSLSLNGKSQFGPTNWCRFMLVPNEINGVNTSYNILLAFDTKTEYDGQNAEVPVFSNNFDRENVFAVCNNEFHLLDFCTEQPRNCGWVDEYILNVFHGINSIDGAQFAEPKLKYLANYIFLIRYIQSLKVLPNITLYSDKEVEFVDVDMVIDMGNSRTCAILFDNHDFTKVETLSLLNFSNPIVNGKLNLQSDSFDMRLAFRKATFGKEKPIGTKQFNYPSMVRLGVEANELIHKATNMNTGVEKISTFSSPKRFLWDQKPKNIEWEFVKLSIDEKGSIWIKGISEQIKPDGSLDITGKGGILTRYSRSALMTFSMLEILAQANRQINSYAFRHNWGDENKPRRLGRIIVTCPTAMSRMEQIALRKCTEEAAIMLNRYFSNAVYMQIDIRMARRDVQVIPSVKQLMNIEEKKEWIYDEATCAQFVYLYAELNQRYKNNCKEYFEFYGKERTDIPNYKKKSLTVGSVDIGAGTTDVMIAAYKYDDSGTCTLTPLPLFWESFYIAGDDLLNNLVRQLIIEGEYGAIRKKLEDNKADVVTKILGFFGENTATMNVTCRQIRSEFNLQVSIPIVTHYLERLKTNSSQIESLSYEDLFSKIKPTQRVLEHFKEHFGFSLEELTWTFNPLIVTKIVQMTFDGLISKISTILSYYGCDIVLLSGRPTSLKPLNDLFLKYYAVSPNRIISLNKYRVGIWYPFHDGTGFFKDSKSIVAVGAMIANYASTKGSLNGFSLKLNELIKLMKPTTEYFAEAINKNAFITPNNNNAIIQVSQVPVRIWTRQLDTSMYPSRPFYVLSYNMEKMEEVVTARHGIDPSDKREVKRMADRELDRIRQTAPFKVNIVRENYNEDKEQLRIESVIDNNSNDVSINYFIFQMQSMAENENFWLDSGEFNNLNVK